MYPLSSLKPTRRLTRITLIPRGCNELIEETYPNPEKTAGITIDEMLTAIKRALGDGKEISPSLIVLDEIQQSLQTIQTRHPRFKKSLKHVRKTWVVGCWLWVLGRVLLMIHQI